MPFPALVNAAQENASPRDAQCQAPPNNVDVVVVVMMVVKDNVKQQHS